MQIRNKKKQGSFFAAHKVIFGNAGEGARATLID
jgi:hypothetical protein